MNDFENAIEFGNRAKAVYQQIDSEQLVQVEEFLSDLTTFLEGNNERIND